MSVPYCQEEEAWTFVEQGGLLGAMARYWMMIEY